MCGAGRLEMQLLLLRAVARQLDSFRLVGPSKVGLLADAVLVLAVSLPLLCFASFNNLAATIRPAIVLRIKQVPVSSF